MVYAKDTELRKIGTAEFLYIVKLLNDSPSSELGSWAVLMRNIKLPNGEYRFSAKDVDLVEGDVASRKKSAAEIFLEEWSTMGKERPTLECLMDLLVEVKLIKAADYIAGLLGCDPPQRPDFGTSFEISEVSENEIDSEVIEEQENDPDFPQTSSPTETEPSTAPCHSCDDNINSKLETFDNTVQHPSSSSSSSSSSSCVNKLPQSDKLESSSSSLSLKATNAEASYELSTINEPTLDNHRPELEYLESSDLPAFLNNNNLNTSESIPTDQSTSNSLSNSDCNFDLPAVLSQYNNKTTK